MSVTTLQEDEEPRRGARTRKAVERFAPAASKRQKTADDEDDSSDSSESDPSSESEDETPRAKQKRARPSTSAKKAAPRKSKGKPRTSTAATKAAAPAAANGETNGAGVVKDDCALFNALTSPDIALRPLIDEWVATYQSTANDETSEKASVHELVTFFIRCCGLNAEIEEDEAMDTDGVIDTLERIQDESVKVSLAVYPLIAKTREARTLRTNLAQFVPHLIKTLALTDVFYQDVNTTQHSIVLLPLILNWLHSMSSSPLRSIRHTSAHLALKINSALCEIAAGLSADLSLQERKHAAEAKKGGQGPAAKKKVAELQAKVTEAREKKQRVEEYMEEVFDVMFVHRVRDADPAIRTECLKELGVWVKKYPELYLSTSYITYFTRGCNDPDSKARLETVKALPNLIADDANVSRARPVLLRLAPRLIEMALRDVDLSVRVHAINLITAIEEAGILEDEEEDQTSQVIRLIFDGEARVRKAVGPFFRHTWQHKLDELNGEWTGAKPTKRKRAGKISDEEMTQRLGYKALAGLLVDTAQSLDETEAGSSKQAINPSAQAATRANAAVEALWDSFEELQEWSRLVEYLLLDHAQAEDMWLLTEEEESLLLQILVACIKHDSKEDDEEERDEQTKSLMNVLPRLFTKHQADSDRMAALLSIPEQMKLSLYLDMRKSSAYDALWDDVTKQFLQHPDSTLLTAAIRAIMHLSANSVMASANESKLAELDEAVFSSLRDAINGEDVSSMTISEDQLETLQVILLRISLLFRSRDIVETVEDEEGGQSTGWEIICAFAERGAVGYKEESKLVEYALQIVFLHLTWLFKRFSAEDEQDEMKVSNLQAKRDRAKAIFADLALREKSNATEAVRRQALISYLNLHMLFAGRSENPSPAAKVAKMKIADEVQHRLGAAFGSAAERYASDQQDTVGEHGDEVERARQELVFLQLVSVFVGAIRCGILEVDHAREPLAYFGRLGHMYDAVVRKLVDVLRDEGIYNKEAAIVQHVVGTALQSSFNTFLESEEEDPKETVGLAKLVSTALVVQGNHFAILKQIHPSDVADLHITSLDYLGKKIAAAVKAGESAKSKAAKDRAGVKLAQALTLLRALVHLTGPITGRDAIKIRTRLEQMLHSSGAKLGLGKTWEPYRAYEKRLLSIAGKDPEVKLVPAKKATQQDGVEDTEAEDEVDDEQHDTPTKSQSSSSRKRTASQMQDDVVGGDAGPESLDDAELDIDLAFPDGADGEGAAGEGVVGEEDLLDLDVDIDMPDSFDRERSASVEPGVKRRRTVKRV